MVTLTVITMIKVKCYRNYDDRDLFIAMATGLPCHTFSPVLQVPPGRENYGDPSERDLDNLLKFHDALQAQISKEGDKNQIKGQSQPAQGSRNSSQSEMNIDDDDDPLLT